MESSKYETTDLESGPSNSFSKIMLLNLHY